MGEVYIAGGYGPSKGLEVWDPVTGNLEMISNELPPEAGSNGNIYLFSFAYLHLFCVMKQNKLIAHLLIVFK